MHLSLSFCNNANPCNNPACSTHRESHIFICKRSFANKVEHNMHLPSTSFASWGRGRFSLLNCYSIFSTTTFAGSETSTSPTHTLLLHLHLPLKSNPFSNRSWRITPWYPIMLILCKMHELHRYVRKDMVKPHPRDTTHGTAIFSTQQNPFSQHLLHSHIDLTACPVLTRLYQTFSLWQAIPSVPQLVYSPLVWGRQGQRGEHSADSAKHGDRDMAVPDNGQGTIRPTPRQWQHMAFCLRAAWQNAAEGREIKNEVSL